MVTGETIKTGVIDAIEAAYPGTDIYKGKVRANVSYPCFFVRQQEATWAPEAADRAKRKYTFDIRYQYDAGGIADDEKIDAVGERLFSVLKKILLSDSLPIFSSEASYGIADEMLKFTVSYQVKTVQEKPLGSVMESLEDSTRIREYKPERNN